MRILYINTTDVSGGAAVVMQRLMRGLHEKYGTENRLLVKEKQGSSPATEAILSGKAEIILEKALNRIGHLTGLLYQSFPFSSSNILKFTRQYKPDIINLHNVQGGYFAVPLLLKISAIAPVVWTLHDMWSFTGNASHTFGNMSWKYLKNDPALAKIQPSIGINTGAWLLKQKKRIYHNTRLSIVTPSCWLKELAEQSPVFVGKNIFHIFNGVDTTVFYSGGKETARQKLGIPVNNKTIMFSSHFLNKNNPWKGGADLLDILGKINAATNEKINLLMTGEGSIQELDGFTKFNVFNKGYIKEEAGMRDCYTAADLFIYPTRADNLPNVLVESIACNTPCITFDIGGNKEIVQHDFNGILIQPFDHAAFAGKTLALLNNKDRLDGLSANCSFVTKKHFLLEEMVKNYFTLFKTLV